MGVWKKLPPTIMDGLGVGFKMPVEEIAVNVVETARDLEVEEMEMEATSQTDELVILPATIC